MVISGVVEVLGGHPPARGSQRSLAGSALHTDQFARSTGSAVSAHRRRTRAVSRSRQPTH
jgi:hypothetical protein